MTAVLGSKWWKKQVGDPLICSLPLRLQAQCTNERQQIRILERQIRDVESRLEHLYDALETGAFSSEELAPSIRKLQAKKEDLELARQETELAVRSSALEMPDLKVIQEYVSDLRNVLQSPCDVSVSRLL